MPRINAIILAGGKSKRMGENKAFLPLGNSTFIQTLIAMLEPLVDRVLISGAHNVYKHLNIPVIEDEHKDSGPLAGLYAGLKWTDTDWNFVISTDTPFVNKHIFELLKTQIKDKQVVIAQVDKKVMPLIGLYHKSCVNEIKTALENKQFKVMQILKQLKTEITMIPEPNSTLLANINTPEEYKQNLVTIQVRFFGQLAELTGQNETKLVLPVNSSINQIKSKLYLDYKGLEYKTYKVALNNTLANDSDVLTNHATVDFLPAFAGG